MSVDDDFCFPTAFDSFTRCSIDSPPLWRLSPAASPTSCPQQTASDSNFRDTTAHSEKTHRFAAVRFTPLLQSRRRLERDAAADDEEEKMDVLWENFNEDLSRSRKSRLMKSAEMESVDEVEIVKARRRVAELNPSDTSSTVTRRKKTTGIVKVLKKFLLMHNSSRRNLETRSR